MSELAPLAERAAPPERLDLPPAGLGLEWRPLTREDAPQLSQLIAAVEEADALPYRTSADEVVETLEMPGMDLGTDTLVGLDAGGTMRAWGTVNTYPGDTTLIRAVLMGGVHADVRRRGIGAALVAWQTARARQVLAASGKEAPARICGYVDDELVANAALYRAAGFAPIRYFAELRRRTDDTLPEVQVPAGVRLEPWPEDDDPVRLVHNAAFADHWGSQPQTAEQWRNWRSTFWPAWNVVAVDEETGAIVGYVQTDRYEHDWEISGYSSGYIGRLGVLREWRGRGVASALLTATMVALHRDGIDFAEIGVDTDNPTGAHRLYAALGFEAFRAETMYTIEI